MDLIVKQGASPALYQPRFVVVCGGGQLRVVTYAFAGDPIGGDRPVSCHGLQRQPLLRIPTAAVSWTNMDPPSHEGHKVHLVRAAAGDRQPLQ